jgi:hypothetical protein
MADDSSQFWNLATGDWELPAAPPRDLGGYPAGRRREEAGWGDCIRIGVWECRFV